MKHRQGRTAAATAASLALLLLSAPSPRVALGSLADSGTSTDPTAPLVAAVALLAWAVAGWLALTILVVLLSRVPGLLGRTAHAVARRLAPRAVRRAVELALGITVAVGAVAPTAALAAPTALSTATATATAPATATDPAPADTAWDLDWPSRTVPVPSTPPPTPPPPTAPPPTAPSPSAPAGSAPTTTAPSRPAPPPSTRATTAPVATTAPPAPAVTTASRAPTPAATPPAVAGPSPAAPLAAAVVVEPGDTLWSLAEASLRSTGRPPTDRQVAHAWPRWWAANREAVGDDPDLLLPGTVLRPPAGSAG